MTTTVTLANMPSSPTDVAVNFLDQTKLELRKFEQVNASTIQAVYVYADGNPLEETLVTVRVEANPAKNTLRCSIRLTTVQVVVVDSVETEREPIEAVIAWNTPGQWEDADKLISMIGTAYSLAFNGVTTKVPNVGILGSINRSLIQGLYG